LSHRPSLCHADLRNVGAHHFAADLRMRFNGRVMMGAMVPIMVDAVRGRRKRPQGNNKDERRQRVVFHG